MPCARRSSRRTASIASGTARAEPLAGLGQALFISASAIFLIVEAVGRILEPEPIARASVGIGVMVFAIIVTTALVTYQRRSCG